MSLNLYSLTLQKPTAITKAITGQFAGKHSQDVVVARGSYLELLRPDKITEKLVPVLSYNCFGILRSIAPFRIAGSSKDHIIVTSDSGRIAILDYNQEKNTFNQIHLETFGKSGIRRVIPGQYLTVDPKGRAAMIASVEKNKLVYVLNRDSAANVIISSPLEAHTSRTLVYDVVSIDMGYDNPMFAALEVDYTNAELDPTGLEEVQKKLTFYELDLGLNHVVRKWSDTVDRHSSLILQVPGSDGDTIGPSGVLVATSNYISYRNMNQPELRVPIPRRANISTDSPTTIVSAVMHKIRGAFFFLVQNELGDLFKITLNHDRKDVTDLRIKYFDTIPLAVSLNILKSGFLFASCEAGSHMFYQFIKLGDDDQELEHSSDSYVNGQMSQYPPVTFNAHPLDNLQPVDELQSLNALFSSQVLNLDPSKDTPQIYTISGQGARSAFRSLNHGLGIFEIVSAELPAVPIAVWTTKVKEDDEFDKYIVLAFANETLVLSIGENVEEVTDSGFLPSVSTIAVQQLGRDSLLQVHQAGLRHMLVDGTVNEWEPPTGTYVIAASTNNYQVAIALSSNSLVYFELDEEGQLNEYEEHQELSSRPTTLSIGDVPEGKIRSPFLAIGSEDATIRIFSLDLENTLETLSISALTASPSDVRIIYMVDNSLEPKLRSLYLNIGLSNGVYVKSKMDSITGQLSDTRKRFLGPHPVKLFKTYAQGQPCVLALCTASWLGFAAGLSFQMVPLAYNPLSHAAGFSSEECPEGIVGIQNNNIRIFSVNNLTETVQHQSAELKYTPRRMVRNSFSNHFYICEADNNTVPAETVIKREPQQEGEDGGEQKPVVSEQLDPVQFGYVRKQGSWASAVEVVDPLTLEVTHSEQLTDNEAAFCLTSCFFESHDKEVLVVATGKDTVVLPKRNSGGYLHVYDYSEDGRTLQLRHKTAITGNDPPSCMIEFQGRLLVAAGSRILLYEMGTKQLLRKVECKLDHVTSIISLHTQGPRVVVADIRQSLTYLVFKRATQTFIPFVDDAVARHTTAAAMIDYDTSIAGDRFGNIFVLRCPKAVSTAADEDEFGAYITNQQSYLGGAPNKLELLAHVFVQDIATSFCKAALAVGGREALIYSGLMGTIGALIPVPTKKDLEFFVKLEQLMRIHDPPLCGRHHLMYRGAYAPVKSVVDGDLCERFVGLESEKQAIIAGGLDRSVQEVCRKIEDIRLGSVF